MLDQKLAEVMQLILSKDTNSFSENKTRLRLIDEGIGNKRGQSLYFTEKDRAEMRTWLQAKGYSLEKVDLSGMGRSERLAATPNEKAGGEAVKQNRISIKALAGQALIIGGEAMRLPAFSHLDVDWTKIAGKLGHRCIMLIENYENFNRIHETKFELPDAYQAPLIIYRGDPHESRFDNVQQFLANVNLPVLAFMDIDPAGIAMASQLVNLVGMVTPNLKFLEEQICSPKTGRRDLFQTQYVVYKNLLDQLPVNSLCKSLWELVSKHRAGVVQERWIAADVCILIGNDPLGASRTGL